MQSEGLIRRFSESFAQQARVRVQMAAAGFRLENGYVTCEFFKGGRSLGVAEDVRPGDAIYELDFDRVDLTATPGRVWSGEVVFYLTSGRMVSDRLIEQVATYTGHLDVLEKRGGRIGLTCENPTPGSARAGISVKTPSESGTYPNLFSKMNVITGIYVNRNSRAWPAPLNAGLSAVVDPCPGAPESPDAFVGALGYWQGPPDPAGGPFGAVGLSCEFRRAEFGVAVPAGAAFLVPGWNELNPRVLLLPGRVLVVQSEDVGQLRVMLSMFSETYRS